MGEYSKSAKCRNLRDEMGGGGYYNRSDCLVPEPEVQQ